MRSHHKKGQKQGSTRVTGAGGRAVDNSADFHAALSAQFLQRYAELFQALAAPVQHVALLNTFATVNDCEELGLTERVFQSGPITCYRVPEASDSHPPAPICPYTQLKQYYWLDFAAVLPPLLLGVQPHHVVLDMCAAPGAKALVLAMQLLLGQSPTDPADAADAAAVDGEGSRAAQQQGFLTPELLQQLSLNGQQQPVAGSTSSSLQQQEQQEPVQQEPVQQLGQQHSSGAKQQEEQAQGNGAGGPVGAEPEQQAGELEQGLGGEAENGDAGSAEGEEEEGEEEEWPPAAAGSSSSSVGRLVLNDVDPCRRSRLSAVLSAHVPGSLRRHVRLTGHDAAKHWSRFEVGLYDRVLLDAPCTSERHVVQAAMEAGGVVSSSSWSREQCSTMAALQVKLLLAGFKALKPGGRLVYTTSSIIAAENDDVITAAVKQSGGNVSVVAVQDWDLLCVDELLHLAGADPTQHGVLVLSDKAGCGPMYVALLQKAAV